MRTGRCGLLATAVAVALLSSGAALAQQKLEFDISEQSASSAIREWAQQAGLQVFAAEEHLRGVRTKAVHGAYMPIEAAQMMIADTGLEIVATGEKTVTIRKPAASGGQQPTGSDRPYSTQANEEISEVVVTGSRIKRAGFDTLQPAIVTNAEEFERRGYVNIGQALEATPGFGNSVNGTGNQATFGAAQTFVNFFGLGTNRTLTLVNGRRFVTSNTVAGGNGGSFAGAGQQVDLNVIPAGLVDRVETVAIGGAPIYGADAIAGTVNIILKDDFEGIQGSAQYGITDESDAESKSFRMLMGGNFADDRGNAVLSVEYNEQEGMRESERFGYYRQVSNPEDTGPNDGIPALRVIRNYGYGSITEGGLPFFADGLAPGLVIPGVFPNGNYIFDAAGAPLTFGPNGNLVPLNRGTPVSDVFGAPIDVSGGDRLDPSLHRTLVAPSQRTLLNGIAHYDITPGVRAFLEAAYAHTEGNDISELEAFAAPTLTGTAVPVSINNAFLSQQARDTLIANGITDTFSMSRNFNDITDRRPNETVLDLQRLVGGLQGDFGAFGETYSWDVSYNYGRSRAVTTQPYINNDRFLEAIDAVSDGGNIVCASGNLTCVPLNLFGQGAPSSAAIDYVLDRGIATSTNTQKVATANLNGHLPFGIADKIAFNVGAEYRREEGSFIVDGTLHAGSFLLGAPLAGSYVGTQGDYSTKEIYTELIVPMIDQGTDMPVIKSLNFEGAARYVDNSITGGDTTWSAGLKLAPRLPGWGDGLMFRGVFTHAIRAPAITELFSGQTPTQVTISDPCSALNYNRGPNPSVRAANCAAALAAVGATAPGVFDQTTDSTAVRGFQQGNQNLENETADSWSAGFVYQPTQLPSLRVAFDWVNISLEQGISELPIGILLTQCYDNVGANPACDAFDRLTPDQAAASLTPRVAGDVANGYRSGYYNTASRDFTGAIFAAEYGLNLPAEQALQLGTKMFYVDKDETVAFTGQDSLNDAGLLETPRLRAQFNIGYSWKWLDVDWQTLWTDSVRISKTATIEDTSILKIGAYTLSNVTLGWRLAEKLKFQVGINNVLDKEPPYEALVARAFQNYDFLGRSYFASLRATF
jgi:iron complex outermembrane recepter protein